MGRFHFRQGCQELYGIRFLSGKTRPVLLDPTHESVAKGFVRPEVAYWLRPSALLPDLTPFWGVRARLAKIENSHEHTSPMQIILNLPDFLATETFNERDWLREMAIALFQQERISVGHASRIAHMEILDFLKLVAYRHAYAKSIIPGSDDRSISQL